MSLGRKICKIIFSGKCFSKIYNLRRYKCKNLYMVFDNKMEIDVRINVEIGKLFRESFF